MHLNKADYDLIKDIDFKGVDIEQQLNKLFKFVKIENDRFYLYNQDYILVLTIQNGLISSNYKLLLENQNDTSEEIKEINNLIQLNK